MSDAQFATVGCKFAGDLVAGDFLLNVGRVKACAEVGVFVAVEVESQEWSLATGRASKAPRTIILHTATEVSVIAKGTAIVSAYLEAIGHVVWGTGHERVQLPPESAGIPGAEGRKGGVDIAAIDLFLFAKALYDEREKEGKRG